MAYIGTAADLERAAAALDAADAAAHQASTAEHAAASTESDTAESDGSASASDVFLPSYSNTGGKLRRRRRRTKKAKQQPVFAPPVSAHDCAFAAEQRQMMFALSNDGALYLRDVEHTSSLDWEDPWRLFGAPVPKNEAEAAEKLQKWVDRNAKKGANLTPEQRLQVDLLLCRNAALFREELGSIATHRHVIHTTDEKPIRARPVRNSVAEREYIRRSVEKMLTEGVI